MSIKEEVKDEIEERLEKEIEENRALANKEKTFITEFDDKIEYFITEFDDKIEYAQGKIRDCSIRLAQHKETKQKMIKEFKEMIKEEVQLYKDEIKEMEQEGDTNISSYYEDLGALSELEELQSQLKDLEELKTEVEKQ